MITETEVMTKDELLTEINRAIKSLEDRYGCPEYKDYVRRLEAAQ